MIYLDHNATTPLAPEAREAMLPFLDGDFGNPSSIHAAGRRALGLVLAASMARVAAALAPRLGYVISKGGITTHTLLADGLALEQVELQGQLLPGLSMVLAAQTGAAGALPVLTFPGNLGDPGTLWEAWRWMEAQAGPA